MTGHLTRKGQQTRDRIVSATAHLIRQRGTATTLDDIRHATSTSKSQLFHYFPDGRDDLLVATAEFEAELVISAQQPFLDELGPDKQWRAWHRAVIDHYVEMGSRCPLGSLTAELGKTSAKSQQIVTDLYDSWELKLTEGVKRRSMANRLPLDEAGTARGILTAIQGGVVMLRATDRVGYLQDGLALALAPLEIA